MNYRLDQHRTPLFDALKDYEAAGTISFHVPGHKQGKGLPELANYYGSKVFTVDATIMPDLDSICCPTGVIREAELLAADMYNVDDAHFLVNGTTSGIQAMIMAVCQPGDKIIVPRNAHKSVIGALVLSGAAPIFVQPQIDFRVGIALGVTTESIRQALDEHPDVKAVFIINPTYYGMASDLRSIVELSHERGIPVLVDEAHGAHLSFHVSLPTSAAAVGADCSAVSSHKLLGSMTQSSMLLVNEGLVSSDHIKNVLNLTQTTSPSYVLLSSLDVARKQMALHGYSLLEGTIELCNDARDRMNLIEGVYVFGPDMVGRPGCFQYDHTKLAINVRSLGVSGHEAEYYLRDNHNIQVELSDVYNLLGIGAIGDDKTAMDKLVTAVEDLANHVKTKHLKAFNLDLPPTPPLEVLPREAFYSEQKPVPLHEANGLVSGETIMAYPPGIPIIVAGERFTPDVIDYILGLKSRRSPLQGTQDKTLNTVKVLVSGAEASLVLPPSNFMRTAND